MSKKVWITFNFGTSQATDFHWLTRASRLTVNCENGSEKIVHRQLDIRTEKTNKDNCVLWHKNKRKKMYRQKQTVGYVNKKKTEN